MILIFTHQQSQTNCYVRIPFRKITINLNRKKPNTAKVWSTDENIWGFAKISFTKGAIESAIKNFLNNPQIIKNKPRFNLLTVKIVLLTSWGKKSLALIIGPATILSKSDTNNIKSRKFVGLIFPL